MESIPYRAEDVRGNLLRLDLNENSYPPSPKVLERIAEAARSCNWYPRPSMMRQLAERLAEYAGCNADYVLPTCGSDEAIELVCKAFLERGDRVVTVSPTFAMYRFYSRVQGAEVMEVPLEPPNYDIGDGFLEKASEAKVVFLCNPNNPTGNLIVDERLVRELLDGERLVVVDEAYYEFSEVSFSKLVEDYSNLVVLRSLSKSFSIAGLRVGYCIACPETLEMLFNVKPPFTITSVSIAAALGALEDVEHMKRNVERITYWRDRLISEINSLDGLRCLPSKSIFACFTCRDLKIANVELVERLKRRGILVKALPRKPWFEDFVRVTVAREEENLRFLEVLRSVIEELGGS
ncbi:MAG: histidinol-phosphate transaminase [Candidatus Verstraetearchaeota archaeon]|nr:histidinol-phosphate transaminase [Candidatus Verstraetearchaeota archaeon]